MSRENVGQNELAARIGSLKGMLAEANTSFLSGMLNGDAAAFAMADSQFLRVIALTNMLQVELAASEAPAQTIYDGRQLEGE